MIFATEPGEARPEEIAELEATEHAVVAAA